MALDVKLQNVFEGPLDLLLHLIEKNKIDIYDIPIVSITDQYMEYLHSMEQEDLGVMSEFLVMAATLLDIKCRMLLPKEVNEEGEEEDPREELVRQLLEYKKYKYLSFGLREMMEDSAGSFFRKQKLPPEVQKFKVTVKPEELLQDTTLEQLNLLFQSIIRRQENKVDPIRSRFGRIEQEEISVSEKLLQVRSYAKEHRRFGFRDLIEKQHSRTQMVVTFLSVLELMKMGHIEVVQETLFGDIEIDVKTDPDTWKNLTEFAEEI